MQLHSSGTFANGTVSDFTNFALWKSASTTVATFSLNGNLNALAAGTSAVTATWGGLTSPPVTVTVTAPLVRSLAVTPASPSLRAGSSQQFIATATMTDGTLQDITSSAAWSSSSTSVATISNAVGSAGIANAASVGTSTISATYSGLTGSTTLTVTSATVVSLSVSPSNPTISQIGTNAQFTATATYSNGATLDVTEQATWTSADPLTISISNDPGSRGLATPTLRLGSTTISASYAFLVGNTTATVTSSAGENPWALRAGSFPCWPQMSMAWSGSRYVWNCGGGFTSTDGLTWKPQSVRFGGGVTGGGIVWAGSQFVALAADGTISTSSDGLAWTAHPVAALSGINSVGPIFWSGSQFVALAMVSNPATLQTGMTAIFTSPDAISWTQRASANTDNGFAAVWTGSKFVLVQTGGSVQTSPDGAVWTAVPATGVIGTSAVAWSGARYVAVGGSDSLTGAPVAPIFASTDAITWTAVSPPAWLGNRIYSAVIWTGSKFVALGVTTCFTVNCNSSNTGLVATSPDGLTWTQTSEPTGVALGSIVWDGSKFVAGGGEGVGTSTDAVNWTFGPSVLTLPATTPGGVQFTGVVWAGNHFVAVGKSGMIIDSPDGVTWTSKSSTVLTDLLSIASSGSLFAVGMANGGILTSIDGSNWTVQSSGTGNNVNAITWTGTQFIAVGGGGAIVTSTDGIHWTPRTSGTTIALTDVASSGTRHVAVGGGYSATGTVLLTSSDAVTWTAVPLPNILPNKVVWTGSQFVVVGVSNTYTSLTSPDGINWTQHTNPFSGFTSLYWDGSQLFAQATYPGSTLLTSTNGTSWTVMSKNGYPFNGMATSGSRLVGVGSAGGTSQPAGWVFSIP